MVWSSWPVERGERRNEGDGGKEDLGIMRKTDDEG